MRNVLLGLIVVALASPAFAGERSNSNKVLKVGDKAPSFAGIPALAPNGEEASLTLSDLKDDVVVVVFLANHCPVVRANDDRIIEFVDDYKDKGVRLVAVSVNDIEQNKLPGIKKRMAELKGNYVYGYDASQAMGKAYGAVVTPSFFVLDKDRVIRYMGLMDDNTMNESKVKKHYLRDAVDAVLAGKTPAVEETRPTGCGIEYVK